MTCGLVLRCRSTSSLSMNAFTCTAIAGDVSVVWGNHRRIGSASASEAGPRLQEAPTATPIGAQHQASIRVGVGARGTATASGMACPFQVRLGATTTSTRVGATVARPGHTRLASLLSGPIQHPPAAAYPSSSNMLRRLGLVPINPRRPQSRSQHGFRWMGVLEQSWRLLDWDRPHTIVLGRPGLFGDPACMRMPPRPQVTPPIKPISQRRGVVCTPFKHHSARRPLLILLTPTFL